jgi:hypothetical protein
MTDYNRGKSAEKDKEYTGDIFAHVIDRAEEKHRKDQAQHKSRYIRVLSGACEYTCECLAACRGSFGVAHYLPPEKQ